MYNEAFHREELGTVDRSCREIVLVVILFLLLLQTLGYCRNWPL